MKKIFATIMICFVLLTSVLSAETVPGRWSVDKAEEWYGQQDWLVGCNFTPSTAINQLEMWQPETFDPDTIDKELGWAAGIGMNTVRVYLHDLLWQQDSDAFLERIDLFLDICKTHGIKPMFVLFDSVWDPYPHLGKQHEPVPHLHNSGWVQSPHLDLLKDPSKHDLMEPYVKGVLDRFKNDPRVLIWDLYNEPGNDNRTAYGRFEARNKNDIGLAFLKKVTTWAREVNPSQPITIGVWKDDWTPDNLNDLNRFQLENSDIISYHDYARIDESKQRIQTIKSYGRPVLCTEYMARTAGNTFEQLLPLFKENNFGAYNWGCVAGKTQTQYPWESWDRQFDAEPETWFHEIFRPDGRPYNKTETDLIKKLTDRDGKEAQTQAVEKEEVQNPMVLMKTSKGPITIELYQDKAPITVDNFLSYVKEGHYNGTIFHRVISGFMIQGGGFTLQMQQKGTHAPITNESTNKLRNKRGTLAMARTNAPNSATCQFFINHVDNRPLDFDGPYAPGYAVFGTVIQGMDVVDAIAAVQTRRVGAHANVPVEPVVIESVTIVK